MNLGKKIVALGTVLVVAVMMMGPGVAGAETAAELQAQIQALQEQLNQLLAQLGQLEGEEVPAAEVPAACAGISFDRNLKQGMSGSDVKCLQALLNTDSDTQVASSGAGSPGNETSYFGPLTRAAVVKFQEKYASDVLAPWGLTAGTGFVGSTTRAKLNELLVPPAEEEGVEEEGVEEEGVEEEGVEEEVPAGELNVSLASDTPVAATIISDGTSNVAGSQALVEALKVKFSTASGQTAKVTQMVVKRTGISTDSDIDNVYLYDGTSKLAEMASMSLGVATFSDSAGLFSVSGERTITVKFDLNKDATSGKTIGFKVDAASDVTTDGATVEGTFPVQGNTMTTAVVADFGRLQVTGLTNSATVDPGTTGFEAMRFTLQASNQNVKVYKIQLLMLGSINAGDIANLKLYDGATEVSSVASLASDKTVAFDLSASPLSILSGVTKTMSVRADVVGGSTRTVQFSLQRATDLQAMDANYNVYVKVDSGTIGTFSINNSTATTVNAGSLVVSLASDSPSGNVALNASNVSLAKYNLQAVGEGIKVSQLGFRVTLTTATNIRNVRLVYDGSQVGTTQTSVATATDTTVTVNFTVPAASTKVLEIRADIASASGAGDPLIDGDSIQARLNTGSNNGQRVVSLGTINVPGSDLSANSVIISSAALSAAKNASVGNLSLVKGSTYQRLGSFLMTAGASEGVDVSSVTFEDSNGTDNVAGTNALGAAFTNLKLMSGAVQLGSTKVTSTSDAATTQYSFYPSPALSVPAGSSVQVDLYGDILSNATWTNGDAVELDSASGTGKVTSTAANIASGATSRAGQTITLYTAGTLSAALDASAPTYSQVVMSSTDQVVAAWKLSANTVEDLLVTQIRVTNTYTAGSGNVRNLKLFVAGSQVGSIVPALDGSHQAWFRNLSISVPRGSNTVITLKADVSPYAEGATAGNYVAFKIDLPQTGTITGASTNTIIARGATSGQYAATNVAASTAYTGYGQFPYRTVLTAALTTTKPATGNARSANDKVATLSLTGTSSADAQLRAAIEAGDDAVTNWAVIGTTPTVAASTAQYIDGGTSILFTEDASAALADGVYYDFTAAVIAATPLNGYSRASFWLRSSATVVANDLTFNVDDTAVLASPELASNLGAATANTWTYYTVNLSSLIAGSRYVGIKIAANAATYNSATIYIDNLRFYNDSVVLDVAGDLNATAPIGTAFYMKIGGIQVGVGYYTGTSSAGTVSLIPDSEIPAGASAVPVEIWVSTTALMKADTTATEVLSISSDYGTPAAAGDFRWYDQAVTATSPVTWLMPVGGVTSVSAGY